jgi:TRAP-type C4-dicarboxylate transport system permease small subunit
MQERLRRVLRTWAAAELALGSLLLAIIVGLIAYQIVARALGEPLPWAEEAGTAMFIWMVLLGASAATKIDRHVAVASLDGLLGAGGRAVLMHFGRIVLIGASLWIVVLIWPFVAIESRSTSVSLPIRIAKSWYFSIPLIACCLSMAISATLLTIRDLLRGASGPDTRLAAELLGAAADEAGKY